MRATAALACSLVAVGVISCSDGSSGSPGQVVNGSEDSAMPSTELTAWVNYGDAVVAVTVVGEEEILPGEEQLETGEGYVARTVTVDVEEVLWEHSEAPSTPDTFDFMAIGWTLHDGQKVDAHIGGSERLEVGERYVVAVTRRAGVVGTVGSGAVLRVDADGRVDAPNTDRDVAEGVEPADIELAGLTLAEVADMVAGTARHPAAEANRALDPEARAVAVQEAEDEAAAVVEAEEEAEAEADG